MHAGVFLLFSRGKNRAMQFSTNSGRGIRLSLTNFHYAYIFYIDKFRAEWYDVSKHRLPSAQRIAALWQGDENKRRGICKEKEKHYEIRQIHVCPSGHSYGYYDSRKRGRQNV
jgi:hypothetical protein